MRDSAEVERQKKADQAERQLTTARSRIAYICYDTVSYGPIWKKGACKPEEITAAQLADNSKATPEEIRLMRKYVDEMITSAAVVADAERASGNLAGAKAAEAAKDAVVVPSTALLGGSITWGVYNKARVHRTLGASR